MSYKALVIDNDQAILDAVDDILASLEHEYDWAWSQQEARSCMKANEYSYILLNLEIPVKSRGGIPRIQNGVNLLDEIRSTKDWGNIPIIIMTDHAPQNSEQAVEMIRLATSLHKRGGVDFINKPFPSIGRTLDRVIKKNMAHRPPSHSPAPTVILSKPKKVQPFKGGELVFYPDRVELCGVKILADSGLGHCRRMLELLSKKNRSGRFVRMGGEELARRIGEEVNTAIIIGTITGCAKTIRSNIKRRLLRDLNIQCTDNDFLVRDDQGYHLDERIGVRDGTGAMGHDPDGPANVPDDPSNVPATDCDGPGNVPLNVPASSPNVPSNVSGDIVLNDRQRWILVQAEKGHKVRRNTVEKRFDISEKTAKRDFAKLARLGLIEYIPKPRPGFYRGKS